MLKYRKIEKDNKICCNLIVKNVTTIPSPYPSAHERIHPNWPSDSLHPMGFFFGFFSQIKKNM